MIMEKRNEILFKSLDTAKKMKIEYSVLNIEYSFLFRSPPKPAGHFGIFSRSKASNKELAG